MLSRSIECIRSPKRLRPMTFQMSGPNNVVYRNESSETHRVTIVASGDANAEVRPRTGTGVDRQSFGRHGGALSLDVPAKHQVEIDVAGRETIGVEVLSVR